jgi:hypothetical protein
MDRIKTDGGLRIGCWGRYLRPIGQMGEWRKLHNVELYAL